ASFKIGALLIKTLAKPVAKVIKNQATNRPAFKSFCVGLAQRMHRTEHHLKMRFLDYDRTAVRPLNEAKAVEMGANFLSESIIFGVAGLTILGETWRTARKNSNRRADTTDQLAMLTKRVEELQAQIDSLQGPRPRPDNPGGGRPANSAPPAADTEPPNASRAAAA
ncbi:OPA3-domain-containing protein, partial [Caulochytrium protostelioides]